MSQIIANANNTSNPDAMLDTSYTINSLTFSGSYYCVIINNVNSNFSVTSNIIQMNLPSATITATPSSNTYWFVNGTSGDASNISQITSASGNDFAAIDFGQSINLSATLDNIPNLSSKDWSYIWQDLDVASSTATWQNLGSATTFTSAASVSYVNLACTQNEA